MAEESTEGRETGEGVPDDRRDGLAVRLSEVARTLHEQGDAQETLDAIVRAAVGTIPGACDAGVMTVVSRRKVDTVAMTGELPGLVDQVQYETGQGPCLTALFDQRVVSVPDVVAEERWPDFAARVRELDVASMLSFQLYVAGDDLGALNLYAPVTEAFDEESEHVGSLFASHAAVALAAAQERDHLAESVHTRDLIGQAKGILMERHKITADQAFALLVRGSQHTNTKVRDLAEQLVRTGELSPPPGRRR
ncbi:GAF and ANTAR domain-containing protein [Saccharothrix algeriensis]|uniref:GAF and ANTAR domain-containing protein n=1 Tax=Saccharothrix algeriensis TaxID=173560 RepID=A0A8T8HVV5_9PSEU|nr:GAF and ANTAR domain-containing protein [Saccharothrix algeriensis]MBM7814260.1 GAF domain-containing protein [Saccharothrix algeriensis]QTR02612.1 GAF and ANTAR domain-containing protein [Saccharothrix algeriensis]